MRVDTNQGSKLIGFYRGKVLQHLDQGRCKIFIGGVYSQEFNSQETCGGLPSAEQASPLFCAGADNQSGIYSYPNINSFVWCFFIDGDQNRPVYFASTLGGSTNKDSSDQARDTVVENENKKVDTRFTGQDAQNHIIKTAYSTVILSETGNIDIYNDMAPELSKQSCQIETNEHKNRSVHIHISGQDGKIDIKCGQSLNIEANDSINIASKQIIMNGDVLIMNDGMVGIKTKTFSTFASQNLLGYSSYIELKGDSVHMSGNNHNMNLL